MNKPIRVGIIGANASQGWAREGHVPAIQSLAGLELVAVATNDDRTAAAAARMFDVAKGYGSGMALIRECDVDLVSVTTRVPEHRELVLAAIAAGKHVYCEWPLGRGLVESREMAAAAGAPGLHASIGLQLRGCPVVRRARELLNSGAIGRLLSARMYSATAGFGPEVPAPYVYLEDAANFANLITIQGAHTLDLAIAIAGALGDFSALASTQYPKILTGENREQRLRSTFDHLLFQSRFRSGAALSVEVAGGRPPDAASYLELTGETGTLRLTGGAARGVQAGRLTLTLNGAVQRVDEGELTALPDAAANVAGVYASLRDDINHGTYTVAGFEHAVKLTQLITDLLASARIDSRISANDWPEK